MRLAIYTAKGGEGKSTTVQNLAAAFARAGDLGLAPRNLRTCAIDFDPQANLTAFLGLEDDGEKTLSRVLRGEISTEDAIRDTYIPGLSMITAGRSLASTMSRLVTVAGAQQRLALALEGIGEDFDVVLIDCPGALGFSFWMAMRAASAYLVPLWPNFAGMKGLSELFKQINDERAEYNLAPSMLGIALVNVDYRLQRHMDAEAEVRERYGQAVFQPIVRTNTHVDEAQARGFSVIDYAPRSRSAEGYRQLAGEVLHRAQRRGLLKI
ncbi:MAG TPA: ParA family protein [Longimicrobium sp.]|nr:ParA family protein [Longimicrobium sp.]